MPPERCGMRSRSPSTPSWTSPRRSAPPPTRSTSGTQASSGCLPPSGRSGRRPGPLRWRSRPPSNRPGTGAAPPSAPNPTPAWRAALNAEPPRPLGTPRLRKGGTTMLQPHQRPSGPPVEIRYLHESEPTRVPASVLALETLGRMHPATAITLVLTVAGMAAGTVVAIVALVATLLATVAAIVGTVAIAGLATAVGTVAFFTSYEAIKFYAKTSGGITPKHAWAVPLLVDSFIVIATGAELWLAGQPTRRAWWELAWPRALLAGAAAVSFVLNVAHAQTSAWPARGVAAIPPAALVLSVELLVMIARRAAIARTTRLTTASQPSAGEATVVVRNGYPTTSM